MSIEETSKVGQTENQGPINFTRDNWDERLRFRKVCLELATRTKSSDGDGRLEDHTSESLIEAAKKIEAYFNEPLNKPTE